MGNIACEHGWLARSCEICERDARISELEAALRQKDMELAELGALVMSHEGHIIEEPPR